MVAICRFSSPLLRHLNYDVDFDDGLAMGNDSFEELALVLGMEQACRLALLVKYVKFGLV